MKAQKILLLGEPMGLFIAQEEAPLDEVDQWESGVAGAELNVAIGLARLGHDARYLTRVGNDPFGKRVIRLLEKNRIEASLVGIDEHRSTGFMLKGKVSGGDPPIHYFRKGSAASAMSEEDVEGLDLSALSGGILHMTGIFPALSQTAPITAEKLMRRARENDMMVSFDPNLRPQLWPDQKTMADTLNRLAALSDLVLPGYGEGEILCGTKIPEEIAKWYLERGCKMVVVKVGAKGAYGATAQGGFFVEGFPVEKVVDTVGAGDGFAAGVLSALAEGLSLEESLCRGNAIGAIQVMSVGDNSGLPNRETLERFMKTKSLEG